jgi:hypothetical protein
MPTYQEQIEANRLKRLKSEAVDRSFERMCGSIADVLLPYINDKTLTDDQAADMMVKIVKAVLSLVDDK